MKKPRVNSTSRDVSCFCFFSSFFSFSDVRQNAAAAFSRQSGKRRRPSDRRTLHRIGSARKRKKIGRNRSRFSPAPTPTPMPTQRYKRTNINSDPSNHDPTLGYFTHKKDFYSETFLRLFCFVFIVTTSHGIQTPDPLPRRVPPCRNSRLGPKPSSGIRTHDRDHP